LTAEKMKERVWLKPVTGWQPNVMKVVYARKMPRLGTSRNYWLETLPAGTVRIL
jgi:hypothetical protein